MTTEDKKRLYCSGCGLEILDDQTFIPWKYSDIYHDTPYPCFPYGNNEGETDE